MKSIIPGDEKGVCFVCGLSRPTEVHHMLHGCRRKKADQYGLTVNLCRECHAAVHDRNRADRALEQHAQRVFEKAYSHEMWMQEFGKNYL